MKSDGGLPRILVTFGTRPEAIKMFPVVAALRETGRFDVRVAVTAQHRELLQTSEAPIAAQVQRWHHAIPRVEFGHVDRLATLARVEDLHRGLHFAGSYGEGGAALPVCWKRGRDVARKIIESASANSARARGLTV